MAIPQMTDVPSYVVYRDIAPGEPFDPTSPLVFFPPKGSDELFDALRIAFPLVKSHSERMREAVIAFLLDERQDDQSQASPAMTMDTMPTTWPSMSSESASLLSSPETLNFGTPASFANSPQPQAPQLTRQASTATSSQPTSPPSLDAMTGVFSLSTSAQPKQRVRRKMTEAEKVEYRKRRIVKACDKCAKRKRKCPHNQAEMETVPNSKSGSKITKSVSKSAKPVAPATQQQALVDNSFASVDDFNFDPATFGPWEDFNMFEDPMAELNMDEFVNFDQQQYGSDLFTPDVSPLQTNWNDDSALLFPSLPATGGFSRSGTDQRPTSEDRIHNGGRTGNGGSIGGSESPDLLNSSYASSDAWSSAGGYARQGNLLKNQQFLQNGDELHGDGMIWEHLRTGQSEKPVPTHTAHVHSAEFGELSGLDDNIGGAQQPRRPPTLSQTVLKLSGTAKAIKAFTNGLAQRTPALNSVLLERASLAISARHHSDGDQSDSAINRRSRPLSGIFDGAAYLENNLREAAESRGTRAQIDRSLVNANPRAAFNLKQSRIQQTQGLPAGISGFGTTSEGVEPTLASTSVSVSDRSIRSAGSEGRPEQVESPAERKARSLKSNTQQGPSIPTLGEGLTYSEDASLDLYMARKRVSSRQNRLAERSATTPLQRRPAAIAVNAGTESLSVKSLADLAGSRANSAHVLATTRNANSSVESGYKFKNGPTSPANGGAYLRLQQTEASPSMTITLKPIRTHTRDPTMYNFNGAMDQHHNSETPTAVQATAGPATALKKSAAVDNASVASPEVHEERLSDHVRCKHHHGELDGTVYEDRLNDTNRHKDHHGRTDEQSYFDDHHDVRNVDTSAHAGEKNHDFVDRSQDVASVERNSRYKLRHPSRSDRVAASEGSLKNAAYCIAVVATILAFSTAFSSALSPTLLLLALLSPVQCTTKNSSWLQNLKGFAENKTLEAKEKRAGTANAVWLRGLMYPHEMAPLQTVRA